MRKYVALLALGLAACGSTVPSASRPARDAIEAGSGIADAPLDNAAGATVATDAAGSPLVAGTLTSPRKVTSAATTGVRGTTVDIGVRVPVNSNGLLTGAGLNGVHPGDSQAMAQTVVDDINARGGISGRKINPVYVPFDVTASTTPGGSDSEQQKACSGFTEDHKVFAAVSPIVSGQVLQSCLATRHVVFVDENWNYFDTDISADNYWDPAYPDPLRSVPALVNRLVAVGWLGPGAKVGAVFQDLANRVTVLDKALRPALARHGLKVDATVAWTAQHVDALAGGALKFRAAGITHVFVLDPGGLETFGWMAAAESQAYRPKYAIDTRNFPILLQVSSPNAQVANARGIGWVPSADVGARPDGEMSAAERRCRGIVAKAGQDMNDPTNLRVAFAYCDTLEFLKTAAGTATLTLANVKVGGEGLADRYAPTGTFAAHFGPHHHDGASLARDLVYDGGCTCFRYTGAPFPIGERQTAGP